MPIYSRNTGNGGTYEYYFCLSRKTKRKPCTRSAVRVDATEEGVERFYSTFQLRPDDVTRLREAVRRELRSEREQAQEDASRASKQLERVKQRQAKLLQAHYAEAVPLDLMKIEMDRLTRERANAETELKIATAALSDLDTQLERVLTVAGSCQAQYLAAPPAIRRQINQGLFVKLYINQDGTVGRAELAEPFAALLADRHMLGLRTETASQTTQDVSGTRTIHRTTMTMAARTWPSQAFLAMTGERRSTKTPRLILSGRGVKDDGVVPLMELLSNGQFMTDIEKLVKLAVDGNSASLQSGQLCRCGCGCEAPGGRKFVNQAHYNVWLSRERYFGRNRHR